jgi:single-strand DNA-binding protein
LSKHREKTKAVIAVANAVSTCYREHLNPTRRTKMNNSPITVIGNVTADPELTFTTSGQARLGFSVAVNYVWYDTKNEKQEKVSFVNVVAWRYTAENGAKTLEKGIGVVVIGRLEQRTYEDKDGNNRSAVEVVAEQIAINTSAIEAVTRRQRSEGGQNNGGRTVGGDKPRPNTKRTLANVGADDEPF